MQARAAAARAFLLAGRKGECLQRVESGIWFAREPELRTSIVRQLCSRVQLVVTDKREHAPAHQEGLCFPPKAMDPNCQLRLGTR